MRVRFQGAIGVDTGWQHTGETAGRRVLRDCGLHEGSRELEATNADRFLFDATALAGEIGERHGVERAPARPGMVPDA